MMSSLLSRKKASISPIALVRLGGENMLIAHSHSARVKNPDTLQTALRLQKSFLQSCNGRGRRKDRAINLFDISLLNSFIIEIIDMIIIFMFFLVQLLEPVIKMPFYITCLDIK